MALKKVEERQARERQAREQHGDRCGDESPKNTLERKSPQEQKALFGLACMLGVAAGAAVLCVGGPVVVAFAALAGAPGVVGALHIEKKFGEVQNEVQNRVDEVQGTFAYLWWYFKLAAPFVCVLLLLNFGATLKILFS